MMKWLDRKGNWHPRLLLFLWHLEDYFELTYITVLKLCLIFMQILKNLAPFQQIWAIYKVETEIIFFLKTSNRNFFQFRRLLLRGCVPNYAKITIFPLGRAFFGNDYRYAKVPNVFALGISSKIFG